MIKEASLHHGSRAVAITTLLLGLGCAACAGQKSLVPSTATNPAHRAPVAPPVAIVAVSPHVSVSDDLVAACKLRFDDVPSAPKFDFDRSDLGEEDNDLLAQIATCVTTGPLRGRSLTLVGRADSRGESEYNMALGDRRASSVGQYLTALGVAGTRLTESSRGKLDAMGTDEPGWQRDRRVDVLLR